MTGVSNIFRKGPQPLLLVGSRGHAC